FFQSSDTSSQGMVTTLSTLTGQLNKSAVALAYPDFFPAAQRDFAARLKWSVTPKYSNANHEPIVKIEAPLSIMASAGEKIRLNGAVSDPDGDAISVKWWQFEVGSYPGKVIISNSASMQTEVVIPKDAVAGQTIHVILEATDKGSPSLTSYQRVIVTVR
ncbi:MAG TPA: hypothetical protein VFP87_11315, partial [Chitinophagaceae bacterium]|nr:hypothetical protein [Chitinophagaceae bacterium]